MVAGCAVSVVRQNRGDVYWGRPLVLRIIVIINIERWEWEHNDFLCVIRLFSASAMRDSTIV
jgi:hypothetical protein